ncbi:hypothetical protein K0M31_019687 [Melipona bicolor]|uniref:Uncharacterized protein n=1 Tax=Melipona bicolor TaxID=60889 RepID=A0AA40G2R9_9HYME|nr:hypothetical protein K0M31_019687 [Melipona bicolor]
MTQLNNRASNLTDKIIPNSTSEKEQFPLQRKRTLKKRGITLPISISRQISSFVATEPPRIQQPFAHGRIAKCYISARYVHMCVLNVGNDPIPAISGGRRPKTEDQCPSRDVKQQKRAP